MAPLPKQDITYNLGFAGVDQKTDVLFAPLGRPQELVNVRSPKTGRLSKRNALVPATSDTVDDNVSLHRLIENGSDLLAIGKKASGADPRVSYGLTPSASYPLASTLSQIGTRPPVPKAWVDNVIAEVAVESTTTANTAIVLDAASGLTETCYLVKCGQTGQTVMAVFVGNSSGKIKRLLSITTAFAYGKVKMYPVPSSDVFVVGESHGSTLNVMLVSSAGGIIVTDSSITDVYYNGTTTAFFWDLAVISQGFETRIFVARRKIADTPVIVTTWLITAASLGSPVTASEVTTTTGPTLVAICDDPNDADDHDPMVVIFETTNGTRGFTVTYDDASVSTSMWLIDAILTPRRAIVGVTLGNDDFYLLAEVLSTFTSVHKISGTVGALGTRTAIGQASIGSRIAITSASPNPFFVLCHYSYNGLAEGLQHGRFLFEDTSMVGVFLRGDVGVPPTDRAATTLSYMPALAAMPADTSLYGSPVVEYFCGTDRIVSSTHVIASMRFRVDAGSGYVAVRDGKTILTTGGFLGIYDGYELVENGFLLWPEIKSVTASNGAGALPNNGSFSIVLVAKYVDAAGQVHRSAPSEVWTATTGASDDTLTVAYHVHPFTRRSGVTIEIYRTENAGTTFYLCSTAGVLVDSDAALIARQVLGQQDGILENYQPNCPVALGSNGRRLFAVAGDDRMTIIEGKTRLKGEGAALFDGVSRYVSQDGDIFAIAKFGDRTAAFKKRRLYVASGDGADDTGAGDTLTEFEAHPMAGVGCAHPRSILETPIGIVFQSEKGFYLLDIGGNITPLGVGIDDYKDFPVVGAVFNPDRNEAIFLLADGPRLVLSMHETEAGIVPRWTTDEDDDAAEAYADLAVVDGLLYAATEERNDGNPRALMVEDVGGHADQGAGYPVVMRVTTGWIPVNGRLYGVRFLGNVKSVHTARVRMAFDRDDTWVRDRSITSVKATKNGGGAYEWEDRPRCEADFVKLEFTEVLESAGAGLDLNQIVLTVGTRAQPKRLPAAQRAGTTEA